MNPYEIEDFFHSIYGVERAWGTPGMLDDFYARAAPDYVYHRPPFPPVHGIEANRKANEDMHKAFSNQKIIIDELAVCEDTAVLRYTWEGVHTGISPTWASYPLANT